LYNNGNFDVDLANWNLSETSSKNFTLNVTIPANGFIILTGDFATFNAAYPNVDLSGIRIVNITIPSFSLADASGEVRLYNSSGSLADAVAYVQASGKAFENVSIGRYPDGSQSIFNISTLTPGAKNDNQAPKLNKWAIPSANNTIVSGVVNVTANITDDTTQVNAALINFNGTNFSMEKNGDLWSFLWNTRLNINARYNITIYFNDTYGKSGFDYLFNISLSNSNALPEITSINLSNTDFLNRTNGSLIASWSAVDNDNDALTANETLWYVNKTLISNYTNKTFIHEINTTKLENWTFSVRVFDGFNWSDFVNSSTIKILNSKPILNITPISVIALETQLVNISLNTSDLDNDLLIITVNKNELNVLNNQLLWRTNITDEGFYIVNVSANDSLDIDSLLINVTVLNARDIDNDGNPDFNDTDDDNDEIADENDFLIGNLSAINATFSLNLSINGSSNFSQLFNGTYTINITNGSHAIIEFNFTFNTSSILDLGNLTINKTTNGSGAVSIRGLRLVNSTKAIFLDKLNSSVKSVCIKDADASFDSISSSCDSLNEVLVICNGQSNGQYTCFDAGRRYRITGISNSAVREQCIDADGDGFGTGCAAGDDCNDNDASKSTSCSSSGSSSVGSNGGSSSGGGGGIVACISNWQCGQWSECVNGFKTRRCVEANQCAFPTERPEESQECKVAEIKENSSKMSKKADFSAQPDARTSKAKELNSSNKFAQITGQAAKPPDKKFDSGFIVALVEVAIILGIYLALKAGLFSKIFKK
ncbi:hypothetical protein HYY70_04745, partial [Candidatus Woesearchaeota archaeon]|nr:hypothetical protein [Candidatus Woesearchaeota archaeon]